MDGSISLSKKDCKIALHAYRHAACARTVRRALVLMLLGRGWSYRRIAEATLVSHETIAEVKRCYRREGVEAALGRKPERFVAPRWLIIVLRWLVARTPQDFGFFRQRWSCEMLSILLREKHGIRLSAETVRRGLRRMDFVWRRPRPVIGLTDPDYEAKLRAIRQLLAELPGDEAAVFQDEVDVHLNPKIGCQWMVRGEQAEVVTPGDNEKRHLAGSLVYRTGTLLVSPPEKRRNAAMFIAHLDDLRRRLRTYRVIHVICDNAKFHDCRAVRDYLARWSHRIGLHFLPKRAPETNPIERVWWRLHEAITRNHRAPTMEELLQQVYDWIAHQGSFFTTIHATYAQAA
jgi:putative transposase